MGCEFYPSCTTVYVTGDGSAVPPDTARFPGAYSPDDPGIYLPDIYDTQEGENVSCCYIKKKVQFVNLLYCRSMNINSQVQNLTSPHKHN